MGIDPLTFVAQIVNLFVLVWILKHFLYKPVLDIIQKRQNEIDILNNEALALKEEAEKTSLKVKKAEQICESECHQKKVAEDKKLHQFKTKEVAKIKKEIQELRQKFYNDLKSEEVQFQDKIVTFVSQDLVQLSENILKELTQTLPMDRVLDLFLQKLIALKKNEKLKINNLLKNQKLIYISSSNTLTQKQQNLITKTLKNTFKIPLKTKIIFQEQKNLILGIEFQVANTSINWTIRAYLNSLEENLNTTLFNND